MNLLLASHLFCPHWCVIWNPEIYEKSTHSKYSMFPLFLQIFSKDSKYFPNIQCFYYFCKHFPMIPVFSKYSMCLLFFPGSSLLGRPKLTSPLFSCCPFLIFKFWPVLTFFISDILRWMYRNKRFVCVVLIQILTFIMFYLQEVGMSE